MCSNPCCVAYYPSALPHLSGRVLIIVPFGRASRENRKVGGKKAGCASCYLASTTGALFHSLFILWNLVQGVLFTHGGRDIQFFLNK